MREQETPEVRARNEEHRGDRGAQQHEHGPNGADDGVAKWRRLERAVGVRLRVLRAETTGERRQLRVRAIDGNSRAEASDGTQLQRVAPAQVRVLGNHEWHPHVVLAGRILGCHGRQYADDGSWAAGDQHGPAYDTAIAGKVRGPERVGEHDRQRSADEVLVRREETTERGVELERLAEPGAGLDDTNALGLR